MKKGLTLVELSIVLVIIGLLIGGILVAKSMVGTARLHNQVKQLQQFDIATQNFIEQSRKLPGDNNLFNKTAKASAPSIILDSGRLEMWNGAAGAYGTDSFFYFPDLTESKMLSENYSYETAIDTGPGHPFPVIAYFGKKESRIYAFGGGKFFTFFGVVSNINGEIYWTMDSIWDPRALTSWSAPYSVPTASPFSAWDALAIDTKIDDGRANSGDIMPFSGPDAGLYSLGNASDSRVPILIQDGHDYVFCAKADGSYASRSDITSPWGNWFADYPLCGLIIRARVYNYKS